MDKKDNNMPIQSRNNGLLNNAIENALDGWGLEPGGKLSIERRDLKLDSRGTDTGRRVTKVETVEYKASETMYPSGKPVYTFSPKNNT